MVYFGKVPPSAGGYTVYPGSHTRLWPCMDDPINFVPNAKYPAELQAIKDEIQPVEFIGDDRRGPYCRYTSHRSFCRWNYYEV